jgi:tRNA U34 5-methylaminomethyl-2-thiouridine-forming methyltransferase MnmC
VSIRNGGHAVKHRGHGEVMHPVGPWEESNRLYVDQLELEKKLAVHSEEPFRILDVGLGAGANAVAALTRALAMGEKRARALEIVSLEIDLTPLRLALADPDGFPWLIPFAPAAKAILEDHRWESPSLEWRVLLGDAATSIREIDGQFDMVFFDPFSPEANPSLWTVDFLRAVRSVTRYDGALLATYSSATPTRVSMLLAGFYVGQGWSTGTRTETTIAASRREDLPNTLGARWLERWKRSSSRHPHGAELTEEAERGVLEHPQFKT